MAISRKPLISYGWLRAILCFVCFFAVYVLLILLVNTTGTKMGAPQAEVQSSLGSLLLNVLVVNLSFFLSAWVFRRFVDRRTFFSLGFKWQNQYARTGVVTGLLVIGLGSAILWAIKDLKLAPAEFAPGTFVFNVLIFLIVAIGEELFFRGYLLNNLLQSLNKWMALAASALLFTVVHIDNPGATSSLLPVLSVFIGGVLFGINYVYTQNLWFGICLHFTWNFLQGPVLGYDVSGTTTWPLFKSTFSGPSFITGGLFGYEGSVFCVLLSTLAIAILVWRSGRNHGGVTA